MRCSPISPALAANAYSVEDILPRMAQIVAAGTGAARAEVWLLRRR